MTEKTWIPCPADGLVTGDAILLDRAARGGMCRLVGRVVDADKATLTIDWTGVHDDAPGAPEVHSTERLKRVDVGRCNPRRHRDQGPAVRTDFEGRRHMIALLRQAGGSLDVLVNLVDPTARPSKRLGYRAALEVLSGSRRAAEWMVRQADGRMPIPTADGPAIVIDTSVDDRMDPSVVEILRAFPGAKVKDLMLRAPDDDEDDEKAPPIAKGA